MTPLRLVSSRFRAPNERHPGAGTKLFTPLSNGACFFSTHVSREELCPLLHVFISFLFTFSVVKNSASILNSEAPSPVVSL